MDRNHTLPRVTGETVVARTKFLEFKQLSYLNRMGEERKWDMVSRTGGRRAVMIIATVGEKLVVTKEFRVPIGGCEYGFPAGLIDDGETAEDAARRELGEETGLELTEILASSQPVFNSPGLSDEAITIVYARAAGTPSRDRLEADEDIQTLLLDRDGVAAVLADKSNLIGAKAWMEFHHFVNDIQEKKIQ